MQCRARDHFARSHSAHCNEDSRDAEGRRVAGTGFICSGISLAMLGIKQGDGGPVAAIAATYGFFSGASQ